MKRSIFAFAVLSCLLAAPALACGLDDCELSDADHLESRRYDRIPGDDWAWMNHDLALARSFLADGDDAKARQIVAGLDYALRVRAPEMVAGRGRARVMAFYRAIREIQFEAGGPGLARLDLDRLISPTGGGGSGPDAAATRTDDDDGDGDSRDDAADEARREALGRQRTTGSEPRQSEPRPQMPETPSPRW